MKLYRNSLQRNSNKDNFIQIRSIVKLLIRDQLYLNAIEIPFCRAIKTVGNISS